MSIKFEHLNIVGWEPAIRGMRNAMNSWAKSDSKICPGHNCDTCDFWRLDKSICSGNYIEGELVIGPNDHELMTKLRNAGTDHRKFMRMITVYVDIIAPLYWWKEFDTYKVGTVSNSCSTMHKIHDKEFTLDDFSYEKLVLTGIMPVYNQTSIDVLDTVIKTLNFWRNLYNETKDKLYWDQMIQLLPSSYNQRRTIEMNYEVLANIYGSRRFHKLDEWRKLCEWIETLPYSEIITGDKKET